ncbi:MAG: threonine synthase [Fibrobacteria bacterium]|jgi:threonine synthase|nr:threonine synthase [Fibrobacteria bacterium]
MKAFSARFRGARTQSTHSLDEVIYRDAEGGLLEVEHDMEALSQKPAAEWKRLFEARSGSHQWPYASGIWGKKEWVLPGIADEDIVSLNEGWTNLFYAKRLGDQLGLKDLWVKLCGNSHTGSFKDLGMTVLVSQVNRMRRLGVPIQAVACASTGDTSAALSAYCAAAGIPSVVFLPGGKISVAQLIQPISNGSIVLSLDTDFDGCMKIVQEITQDKSLYLANSMNSLRIEGQKTISFELCQQFGWEVPDVIVIPGGNLGNVSALGRGFDMMLELGVIDRKPRIVVAQAANANPLYEAYRRGFDKLVPMQAKKTEASAIQIGNPVSYERAVKILKKYNGEVYQVTEQQLADAAHRADLTGLYCDPHTGVALGALEQMVDAKKIGAGERVVIISTAHGLKFSEFKTKYHEKELADVQSKYANPILSLPADVDKVRDALRRRMG